MTGSNTNSLIDILLRGIGPLILAAIASYIAYQQYRTNLQKLKLDLYDRRLRIFDSIVELGLIVSMLTVNNENESLINQLKKVKAYQNEAYFLLGEKINTEIDRLCKKAEDLIVTKETIRLCEEKAKNRVLEIEQAYKQVKTPLDFEDLERAEKIKINWESSQEKNELAEQIELIEYDLLKNKERFDNEINNMRDIFYPYLYFGNVLVRNDKK